MTNPAVTDDETTTNEEPAEEPAQDEPAAPVEELPMQATTFGDGRDINEDNEEIPEWARPYIRTLKQQVTTLMEELGDLTADGGLTTVRMTVESGRFARRSEESGRIFVLLSYPSHGNHHITELLLDNLKNPLEVSFAEIQARLPEPKAAASTVKEVREAEKIAPDGSEIVTMSVNGEDGQKVRTGRRRATTPEGEQLDAARTAAETPHAFERQDGDSRCKVCLLGDDDGVHALHAREHAFVDSDELQGICGVCGGNYDDERHLVAMSPEAQALIDGIAQPVEA